jgi:hypothetical protein
MMKKRMALVPNLRTFFLVGAVTLFLSGDAWAWNVKKTNGQVSVTSQGKKVPALVGGILKEGDTVETAGDSKVMIQEGESEVWLAPGTRFVVHKLANAEKSVTGRFEMLAGKLRAKFKKPSGPEVFPYEIRIRSVVAGVRGTEFFMAMDGEEERVCTLEGLVRVTSLKSAAESWDVAAGKGLFIKSNEMPKVRDTTAEQVKKWVDISSF